jgi:hypothetical protein
MGEVAAHSSCACEPIKNFGFKRGCSGVGIKLISVRVGPLSDQLPSSAAVDISFAGKALRPQASPGIKPLSIFLSGNDASLRDGSTQLLLGKGLP